MTSPAEQREGRDLDLVIDAVEATQPHVTMDRSLFAQGDDERWLVVGEWLAMLVAEGKGGTAFLERQVADLVQTSPEQ